MVVKLFEVRDRDTLTPVIALRLGGQTAQERWLLTRGGFGASLLLQELYTYMIPLTGNYDRCHFDPLQWGDRTLKQAHLHIASSFDSLQSGQVIDVEYLLGETNKPKTSEYGGGNAGL